MKRSLLTLLGIALLVAACSRTELLYDNAGWLIARWTSNLLDPDDDQRQRWRGLIDTAMEQHRSRLLPDVVVLLDQAGQRVERGLQRADLQCLLSSTDGLLKDHARFAIPTVVQVLGDLSPDQLAHYAEQLAERNREYREDYLHDDLAERETLRVERFVERVEYWTGDLSTEQLRVVESVIVQIPDVADDWLRYRERQQSRLLALLEGGEGARRLKGFLTSWWVDQDGRDEVLIRDTDRVRAGSINLIMALVETLSAEQRTHLLEEIAALRNDLAVAASKARRPRLANLSFDHCARAL